MEIKCDRCGKSFSFDDADSVPNMCPFCGNKLKNIISYDMPPLVRDTAEDNSSVETDVDENTELPDVPFPKKPTFLNSIDGLNIIKFPIGVIFFGIGIWGWIYAGDYLSSGDFLSLIALPLVIGLFLSVGAFKDYYRAKEKYRIACTDFQEYRRICAKEETERIEAMERVQAYEEERLSKLPECPICKSKEHVQRIGKTERAVDLANWGYASASTGNSIAVPTAIIISDTVIPCLSTQININIPMLSHGNRPFLHLQLYLFRAHLFRLRGSHPRITAPYSCWLFRAPHGGWPLSVPHISGGRPQTRQAAFDLAASLPISQSLRF